MPKNHEKQQSEKGQWLLVGVVFAYALAGLAAKYWPIDEGIGPEAYAKYLAQAGPDDCGE